MTVEYRQMARENALSSQPNTYITNHHHQTEYQSEGTQVWVRPTVHHPNPRHRQTPGTEGERWALKQTRPRQGLLKAGAHRRAQGSHVLPSTGAASLLQAGPAAPRATVPSRSRGWECGALVLGNAYRAVKGGHRILLLIWYSLLLLECSQQVTRKLFLMYKTNINSFEISKTNGHYYIFF